MKTSKSNNEKIQSGVICSARIGKNVILSCSYVLWMITKSNYQPELCLVTNTRDNTLCFLKFDSSCLAFLALPSEKTYVIPLVFLK
jgi:hypothetical protein